MQAKLVARTVATLSVQAVSSPAVLSAGHTLACALESPHPLNLNPFLMALVVRRSQVSWLAWGVPLPSCVRLLGAAGPVQFHVLFGLIYCSYSESTAL